MSWSWTCHSGPYPAVRGCDLSVNVAEGPALELPAGDDESPKTYELTSTRIAPQAVSLAIGAVAVKVSSYQIAVSGRGPELATPSPALVEHCRQRRRTPVAAGPSNSGGPARPTLTHIVPPRDLVKLEDRLRYLLQPPLEQIVQTEALPLPFDPFPYQYVGIAFLYPRAAAILADEMGLGKTMQAVTAIRLLIHAGEIERVLLVCPKPLVTNWLREFELWAPELPALAVEGDQARRHWQWTGAEAPVKVANYEAVLRDRDVLSEVNVRFDLVVLDEAQRIKNRNGATSGAIRSIHRRRSWALTGTPVENSPEDLVGIFEFLVPGHLHGQMRPRRMGEAVRDYTLRRTKDAVLTDLPPKLFRDARIEISAAQRQSYLLAEEEGVVHLSDLGNALTIHHVFELVLRLKQICNFDPATGESTKCEQLAADLEEVAASGRKAIVFSQWVETLVKLREPLAAFAPLEYHGRIPSNRRDAIVEQFRNDPAHRVLLMTYGAGAVGLNLQFCQYVFLFDRWWNPAVEDQAINRAHRIGAAGPVTVTRFLALDTIEERIDQVLEEKRHLFETILSGAEGPRSTGLTQDEVYGLFKLATPRGTAARAA